MFTPNKLNYAKCPHCNITLNQMDWVPMSALANPHFTTTECPACFKGLVVRVHVTFNVEADKAEAFDYPCDHDWFHYEGDHFEKCKKCEARQPAARER